MDLVKKEIYISPELDRIVKEESATKGLSESEVLSRALEAHFVVSQPSEVDPWLEMVGMVGGEGPTIVTDHDDIYDEI